MADEETIYAKCTSCGATGTTPVVTGWGTIEDQTCTACNGALKIVLGTADGLATLVSLCGNLGNAVYTGNIFPTYQIMEATDITEFAALSTTNKTAYRQLISCGVVDLTDGTAIRASLWSMFDAQSTTRANLITLLGE